MTTFQSVSLTTWLALLFVLLFSILLFTLIPKVKWNARMLAYGALCVALSFVLSCVRLFRMPQGGSVTPASMLPVMLFAYAFGVGPGLICGMAYGALQMLQDFYVVTWVQALLDYPIAFSCLALAGVFRSLRFKLNFSAGVLLAGLLRIFCHVLSGVFFFGEYVTEGMNPWVYSLLYNLSCVGVDALICALLGFLPPVRRFARTLGKQRA